MGIKFTSDRNTLLSAINPTLCAVSTKSTNPATECLMLQLEDDNLSVCGFDTEKGVYTSAAVHGRENGAILINAQRIAAIIRSMPDCTITFDADEKFIASIVGGDSSFAIHGLPATQFPALPDIHANPEITIKASALRDMISSTSHAVAAESTKPIFLGELFEISAWNLRLVAADFCRLAVKSAPGVVTGADGKFIVPGKFLTDLVKLTSDEESGIGISMTRKHIVFHCQNVIMFSRLIEGDFLDCEKVIPKNSVTDVLVDRHALISMIERAALIIDDKLRTPMKFRFADDSIDVSCESSYGKVNESLSAHINGQEITIGFNHKYLLEALKSTNDVEVNLSLFGELKPITIHGENYTYLILPLRLK